MARIQILELPTMVLGELAKTPFAIIIDQVAVETDEVRGFDDTESVRVATVAELTQDEADQMARNIGAAGAILAACTLDVA